MRPGFLRAQGELPGGRASEAVAAPAGCGMSAWGPSQNSSIAFALKAGMSSGLRLVTRPWSTWTSSSTQVPPALRTSVCSDGHEVIVRPLTMPASTSIHGPWQIAAIGLRAFAKSAANANRVLVRAQEVGVRDAAGDRGRRSRRR